jgi:hypothetical protein
MREVRSQKTEKEIVISYLSLVIGLGERGGGAKGRAQKADNRGRRSEDRFFKSGSGNAEVGNLKQSAPQENEQTIRFCSLIVRVVSTLER